MSFYMCSDPEKIQQMSTGKNVQFNFPAMLPLREGDNEVVGTLDGDVKNGKFVVV